MTDIAVASLVLSSLVVMVASGLAWGEWRARRERPEELAPEDADHFVRQDARRSTGIGVLIALAVGLVYGSRLPAVEGRGVNPTFVWAWTGILGLIVLLLWLALRDWVDLRRFAARHRRGMLRERIEILRDEALLRMRERDEADGSADREY